MTLVRSAHAGTKRSAPELGLSEALRRVGGGVPGA